MEEIPAYTPSGEGDHLYLWIEKRELTTAQAMSGIAKALGIRDSDMGAAGMKDKFAVTRQYLSLPPGTAADALESIDVPGLRILEVSRHGNKLRTGHLRGNRFRIRIADLACTIDEACERAQAVFATLRKAPGAPNWYGAQRFGRGGLNARIGKELVTKSTPPGKRAPKGRQRRLYISAYQSELFNRVLAARIEDGLYDKVVGGDLLQKTDSGGVFSSEDLAEEQGRLDSGALAITGPMFGHKMKTPPEGTDAAAREMALLAAEEISLDSFAHLGKLAQGTRRALSVAVEGVEVAPAEAGIEIHFALPSGSYATAILREVMKGDEDFPN